MLASDGVANVGATDAETILGEIRHDAEAGIQLVSVGFGMGNFNDALLEQLADDGDGFYAYVDDLDEARRLFVDDLTGTLQSVALDARVQVEFDAAAVEAYRLVGFENRAIDDRDFRNDEVDGRRDRCRPLGDGALRPPPVRSRAPARVESGRSACAGPIPRLGRADELALDLRLVRPGRVIPGRRIPRSSSMPSSPRLRSASAAAAWGETYDLDASSEVADQVAEDLPQTQEVHDFLELLEAAEARTLTFPFVGRRRGGAAPAGGPWPARPAPLPSDREAAADPAARAIPRPATTGAVPSTQLQGGTVQDPETRGVVLAGELDDERSHLGVVGPRGVDDVRPARRSPRLQPPGSARRRRASSHRPR